MTNRFVLSYRLQKVASFLPKGPHFADIGSDHAYLPCYICLNDSQARAIAGEVNQGPFQSAKDTVEKYHLQKQIDVRLGDGLSILREHDNVLQVVIAGMGGALISQILEEGKSKLKTVNRLIVQPNVDARQVRKWLHNHQYQIVNEDILEENGHIYEVIVADKVDTGSAKQLSKREYIFGPILIKNKTKVFLDKWTHEYKKLEQVLEQIKQAKVKDFEKINRFEEELQLIREELEGLE